MFWTLHFFSGVIKPCISKILNVQESQRNVCLNTVMEGTAFFLPCHSSSIFSYWNLQFGQGKIWFCIRYPNADCNSIGGTNDTFKLGIFAWHLSYALIFPCRKNPNSKVPYHYYQPTSTRECSMYHSNERAKSNGHRFMTEKAVFARWSILHPKIYFKYPEWSAGDWP